MWVFPGIFTITSIQKNVVTLDITIFVEKNQSEGRIVFWFLHFWKISKLFVYIWTVMLKYNIIFEHVLVGNLHFAFFSYSEKPMNFWENIYGISSRKSNITWNESLMWFMSYCRNFHHIYSLLIIKKTKKISFVFLQILIILEINETLKKIWTSLLRAYAYVAWTISVIQT